VLKDRSTLPHYWASFWVLDVGWISCDLALGKGLVPEGFTLPSVLSGRNAPTPENYYFGSMDAQRIAFSFGENILNPMDGKNRVNPRPPHQKPYALQNIWEEASKGIESYSSLWSEIMINGVYFH
jgi:hypothetical protein